MPITARISQMEPELRELNSGSDLDAFLTGIEQEGALFLPDIGMERVRELDPIDTSEDNPLQVYWREVSRVPPLPPDREAVLLRTKSAAEKKELVEANLSLAATIAGEYRIPPDANMLDQIITANNGVISAIDTFRPERGYRLSTYAAFCIHRALNRSLRAIEHRHRPGL